MLGGIAASDYEAEDGACCQSSELKASKQRQRLSRTALLDALWMGVLQLYASCTMTLDGVWMDTSDTNSESSG